MIIPLVTALRLEITLDFASAITSLRASHSWYYHPNCTLRHAINYTYYIDIHTTEGVKRVKNIHTFVILLYLKNILEIVVLCPNVSDWSER